MKKKLSLIFVFMFMLLGLVALNTKPVMAASETEVEAELNNIVVPDKAIIDFPVVSVSVYGSTIEWKSDKTNVISVPANGGWTTVKRQNVDVTVTLTVTLTNGEIVKTKDFKVLVPMGTTLTNTYKIEYVLNGGTNNAQNPTEYKVGETKEILDPTKGEVEFQGWYDNEKFEGEAITSLPKGLSGDYKLYAKWAPATVKGIEVTTLPTKVAYKALETFDKTGLVVNKLLNDGTKEEVALDEVTFDKDVLHYGNDKVVVKWNEFTAEIAITVSKIDYDLTGIKFDDLSLPYNGKAQTINYTGDLPEGLTATVKGSATNVTTTPVTITLVFTNTNDDYNTPDNKTAELTITKAPLTVTASSASIKVGEDVPTFTVSYDGFVNGETEKVLGGKLTITCSATKTSPAGSYDVVPAGLTAENYEIEFVNGTLTINSGEYTIEVTSKTTVTYNGENQMFTVVLKDGNNVIEGITFTYTLNGEAFTGATNAGTYEVTVSYDSETYGKGTTVVKFVIEKADFDLKDITLDETALTYNGQEQNLKLVGTLPVGVTAVFSEGLTNVGTKEIVVTFTHSNANYNEITTTLKGTLTINAKALDKDMFDKIPEQAYTGNPITPEVTGKFNGTALVLSDDFEVGYTKNTDKGTATVTVIGKGNFTGEITLTFVIGDSVLEKVTAAKAALEAKYASVLTGTLASTVTKLDVVAENGSVITWASNNTVLSVDPTTGVITIKAVETDQEVTLTAIITYGDVAAEYAPTFTFVVKAEEKIEEKTIQEMIDAEVSDTYFTVTGIVRNITNTEYGNFNLVDINDSSISIYVYGLLTGKDGQNKQFKTLGIVEGDTLTLVGKRGLHNGKIEIADAYYVSHNKTKFTLTVSSEDENKGTVTPETMTVENGSVVTLTITPAEGYKVSAIVINGIEAPLSTNTYDIIVDENTVVVIKFVEESTSVATYKLVTDVAELKDGDKIVLACNTKNVTAGAFTSKYLSSVSSTFSSDKNTIESLGTNTEVFTLKQDGENWQLIDSNDKAIGTNAAKALLSDSGTLTWTITITSEGVATVASTNTSCGRILYNVSAKRFMNYTSDSTASMILPQIYKLA